MKTLFFLFLIPLSLSAATYEPVKSPYSFQDVPEYKAIIANLRTFGEFPAKDISLPKAMSRGEQMVEEARARNRARLKEMYAEDKKTTPKEKISDLRSWKEEEKRTLSAWKNEAREELNTWKREQEIFLGRIKIYKENTFNIPAPVEKIIEKKIAPDLIPSAHVVHSAFSVPMKDQFNRPTCVAFAGIRALEIILAQNNVSHDLSEQYLYWAGKPKCQKNPCKEKGSWIREAYQFSKAHPSIDIPLEANCTYKNDNIEENETQVPLTSACLEGVTKVTAYQEVKTLADVVESVKKNVPVVVAARLSENFYKNKGLITLADSESSGKKLDNHSLGHAFLAVGIVELPSKLKASEGDFCLLVANSRGKGWGAGGYSCVTQKWFEKFRRLSSFIAPVKISVK